MRMIPTKIVGTLMWDLCSFELLTTTQQAVVAQQSLVITLREKSDVEKFYAVYKK